VNLGNLTLLLTLALGLSDVTAQLGLGDIDPGLVACTFVRLTTQRLEIVRAGRVLELFDLLRSQ
jgi:hypothetical protein